MRVTFISALILLFISSIVSFATTPGPCAGVCEVYEAIVEKAKAEPEWAATH